MNPDLKAKWVKALRSGRYRQVDCVLSDWHGGKELNCCLGVLCRVARVPRERWETEVLLSDVPDPDAKRLNLALGLDVEQESALSNRNDNGDTFEEIADYIEEKL